MFFLFIGDVQAQNGTQLKLVWDEEFNQPNGSSPDLAKWSYDLGSNGINSELEYYTSRTNNARIVNGQLVIEADHESYGGASYTSARLKTQGKWSWTYGRIEARIKIPRGQGIWPAFWTLGDNINSVSWPTCGEIDILENIGNSNNLNITYGTIHGPVIGSGDYKGGAGVQGKYALPGRAVLADDFHVYAVQWTTNQIQWFVDTNLYFTATPASLPSGGTWVFTQPQFLTLNVAVGGTWPGNPDGTTVFPQQMLVDYVRVYQQTTPLQISATQANGIVTSSWPTNNCRLQTKNNSIIGGSWFVQTNISPLIMTPDPNNACVYFRLESPQ
jgi:beta-glucanase (GH16 family)